MNRAGRDEEDVARLERHRRLSFQLVLERRPFENVDDLLTRMRVPGGRHSRVEFDDGLDDLASRDAQIVPLEIDAPGSRELRLSRLKSQGARDDDRRGDDPLHHQWNQPDLERGHDLRRRVLAHDQRDGAGDRL